MNAALPETATPPRAARAATIGLFFVNGMFMASVAPRLPEIRDGIGLSDAALGLALAAMPVGALLAGLFAGVLVHRFSGGRLAVACAALWGLVLASVGLAPSWWTLAAALFVFGAFDSVMDVAQNTHGLHVERRYRRPIINSFHGWWSIGAATGSLIGSVSAGLRIPVAVQLAIVGGLLTIGALVASRGLLPAGETREVHSDPKGGLRWSNFLPMVRAVGVLCLILLLASVAEDIPGSWSAIYLRDDLHVAPGAAGLAYVAFAIAMTIGRFTGDGLVHRFGPVLVTRIGTALGSVALIVALLIAEPWAAIAGLAVMGFGISTLFPLVFAAAGNRPGVRTGDGIAFTSFAARLGFFLAPPTVGLLSDTVGLPWGIAFGAFGAACACLLAGTLAPRRAQ